MALAPIRGKSHAERLESFYAGQAGDYDAFRARLLQGRAALMEAIDAPDGARWVDMGGGTAANLEALGDRIGRLSKIYVVDLSPSLLAVARRRARDRGWSNVEPVEGDATTFVPPGGPVDVVTFSYALTMIPDWYAAIDHARRLLRPDGRLGVVDFYVARKYPAEGRVRHPWRTRWLWPAWFATDNVFLSPDHVPYLHRGFAPLHFSEHRARVPYVPFGRVPYYLFIGRPRPDSTGEETR